MKLKDIITVIEVIILIVVTTFYIYPHFGDKFFTLGNMFILELILPIILDLRAKIKELEV